MSERIVESWHRGILAPRVDAAFQPLAASRFIASSLRSALTPHRSPRNIRAFSLIEVLLAIFILGIGVISIAALFPAGIAQQRRSADDIIGTIVANNAIELIRTKIRPEDFGTYEEFPDPDLPIASTDDVLPNIGTIPGDWAWMRPGILFEDDTEEPSGNEDYVNERGMLDIFSYQHTIAETGASPPIPFTPGLRASENADGYQDLDGNPVLWGIPYNTTRHSMSPGIGSNKTVPYFTITQQERYYPMQSQHASASVRPEAPQYVWDCMFRRFGGRIYVAVFVYRVNISGGGGAAQFYVPQNPGPNSMIPPLPVSLNLVYDPDASGSSFPYYCAGGPWDAYGLPPDFLATDARVYGTASGTELDLQDARQAWQQSGQWLLDQNLNIHRVLGAVRPNDDLGSNIEVELVRPAASVLGFTNTLALPLASTGSPNFYFQANPGPTLEVIDNVVSNIWYIPATIDLDLADDPDHTPDTPATLTPVFATVQEL